MRVLIVENELYLAQNISNKLNDEGYTCEIATSVKQIEDANYDVILLSAAINDFLKVAQKHSHAVIILLVSYISVDSVVTPIKMGVSDYIQKPFMIEELLRKIKHHQHFKALELLNKSYKTFIESRFAELKAPKFDFKKIKLPLVINAPRQIEADYFAFEYAKAHHLLINYIELNGSFRLENFLLAYKSDELYYFTQFASLRPEDRQVLLNHSEKKNILIAANLQNCQIPILHFGESEKSIEEQDEILTIDEYVKFIITNYQDILPDTDLSKKLGISRKSLWERRKKYELTKKK